MRKAREIGVINRTKKLRTIPEQLTIIGAVLLFGLGVVAGVVIAMAVTRRED